MTTDFTDLKQAFAQFATGVVIVTCDSEIGPLAMTANSFSSVSLDPALVLWCAGKGSKRCDAFTQAPYFAIHVLEAEQAPLAKHFARSGDDFSLCPWQRGNHSVPLLEKSLARFECRQYNKVDAGDHSIIVGAVERFEISKGAPLIFAQSGFGTYQTT
ncbi:MAG: flavin reductase family protein [Halocynthiibacter sp.]